MINLIKGNLYRISKSYFYILGCVLAFALTYFFVDVKPMLFMNSWKPEEIAILVSAATIFFYSIFTGVFVMIEYTDNAIRNKVIAGHSQTEIYFSDLIALVLSNMFMLLCWVMGGVCAGVKINSSFGIYILVCVLYNIAYIAVLNAVSFRITNLLSSLFNIMFFYFCVGVAIFGNYFVNFHEESFPIIGYIYRMNGLGQYMTHAGLSVEPDVTKNICLSLIVIVVSAVVGMLGLKKRNTK